MTFDIELKKDYLFAQKVFTNLLDPSSQIPDCIKKLMDFYDRKTILKATRYKLTRM